MNLCYVQIDYENNASTFWDFAYDRWEEFCQTAGYRVCNGVYTDKTAADDFIEEMSKLPGWLGGPSYAQTPIIVSELTEKESKKLLNEIQNDDILSESEKDTIITRLIGKYQIVICHNEETWVDTLGCNDLGLDMSTLKETVRDTIQNIEATITHPGYISETYNSVFSYWHGGNNLYGVYVLCDNNAPKLIKEYCIALNNKYDDALINAGVKLRQSYTDIE